MYQSNPIRVILFRASSVSNQLHIVHTYMYLSIFEKTKHWCRVWFWPVFVFWCFCQTYIKHILTHTTYNFLRNLKCMVTSQICNYCSFCLSLLTTLLIALYPKSGLAYAEKNWPNFKKKKKIKKYTVIPIYRLHF